MHIARESLTRKVISEKRFVSGERWFQAGNPSGLTSEGRPVLTAHFSLFACHASPLTLLSANTLGMIFASSP